MTGFASVSRETERAAIGVTVRALNHRYLDLQIRLPSLVGEAEARVRGLVQRRIGRGRLEVTVSLQLRQPPVVEVELNAAFTDALSAALDEARARGLVAGTLAPGDLVRLPQALVIRERPVEQDADALSELTHVIEATVDEALAALDAMRITEGEHLREDLNVRRAAVGELVERVAVAADEGRAAVQARLTERVQELTADLSIDRAGIAQEVVRFAARSDISEEVARFRGHLAHWEALTDAPEPCGRKLDFLLQEMNREVNTIGSKADGLQVSEIIIAAKAELEKMREQVQNAE